jgi:hypothetical protein
MHSFSRFFLSRFASRQTCSSALALLAAFALAGCDRATEAQGRPASAVAKAAPTPTPLPKPPVAKYQRDLYGKLDDCVADWGFAGKCTPVSADAPERAQGGTFFGPIYSNALRFESQLTSRREAFEQGYLQQVDLNPSNKAISSAEIKS